MKKLAGAAIGTLLIASMIAGSAGISGTVQAPMGSAQAKGALETNKTVPAAAMPAAEPAETSPEDAEPAASEYAAYLFVHFIGDEQDATKEQIYFSLSTDGTNWNTLNDEKPVLESTIGEKGVRDPFIIRKQDDSGFVIIATDLSIYNIHGDWTASQEEGSKDIIIWESDGNTLAKWKEPRNVTVGVENAGCVWAPEAVWDKEKNAYMVFWASKTSFDGYNVQRVYRSYTEDFVTFTPAEVYIERVNSMIDTTIYYNEANETYYRFTKDEGNKWVFMEQGKSLSGAFEMVSTYSIDGKHYSETENVEGPTVYKINGEDKWCLLLDQWNYKPFETDDITKGAFTTAGEFNFNGVKFRHGSVIPITQTEYDALAEAYKGQVEEPDPETGKLIYQLDFEGDLDPTTDKNNVGGATMHGTTTFIDRAKGKKAVQFNKDASGYLSIPGTLFAGLDCFTVSFMARIPDDKDTGYDQGKGVNWLLTIQPREEECAYRSEHYLSVLWEKKDNRLVAQRFNSTNQDRPADVNTSDGTAYNKWVMVTVIYGKTTTKLYINAVLKATMKSDVNIKELLGDNPVAYLGYAHWSSGEYSYAEMDTFRVYDGAIPESTMQAALTNESAIGL